MFQTWTVTVHELWNETVICSFSDLSSINNQFSQRLGQIIKKRNLWEKKFQRSRSVDQCGSQPASQGLCVVSRRDKKSSQSVAPITPSWGYPSALVRQRLRQSYLLLELCVRIGRAQIVLDQWAHPRATPRMGHMSNSEVVYRWSQKIHYLLIHIDAYFV